MKRLMLITCSFLVFFAGAVSAWASCKQIAFATKDKRGFALPLPAQDHHSHEGHQHSHESVIHCPTLDEFVPIGIFSAGNDHRAARLAILVGGLDAPFVSHGITSNHGPPGSAHSTTIPPYLLLSVLRI